MNPPSDPEQYRAACAAALDTFTRLQQASQENDMAWLNIVTQLVPVVLGIIAAISTTLATIFHGQKKDLAADATTAQSAADVAFTQARTATQAVAEIAPKLPPPPPGGHGFTDSTQSFLLNLPKPLTAPEKK